MLEQIKEKGKKQTKKPSINTKESSLESIKEKIQKSENLKL